MKIAALIVAAGRGARAGGEVPKQYAKIGGAPVIVRSLHTFASLDDVAWVQYVIHPEDVELYRQQVGESWNKLLPAVFGGATRQASVLAGLLALEKNRPDAVFIHDAARPFVSPDVIRNVISALSTHDGAIAAVPLSDTLKRADANGTIAATVDRANLWRAQTPQGFHFQKILKAHRDAAASGKSDFTDDAAIAEWAGLKVALVDDSRDNFKLTTAEDLQTAEKLMSSPVWYETRTGTGFDVHKFCEGDHVWLGGVKIPHMHSLEGHSDADVVLHALTDAILGAIGEADIGQHFPPTDPKWKGAASRIFLEHAAKLVADADFVISNVDVTVLAEAPKIGPHRDAMKKVIAEALGITPGRVGIKATTMEGLGFIGRREGLAAQAIATLRQRIT